MRVPVALTAAFALALAACDAPTVPARNGVYPFQLQDLAVQRVMHWKLGSVIRVAAVPGGSAAGNISTALDAGIAAWNAVALYGEYEIRRVESPADADVIVAGTDVTLPVDLSNCLPSGSGLALTTFCLTTDRAGLIVFPLSGATSGPGQVRMVVTVLASSAGSSVAARRLVAHELGHVLGIAQHSPNSIDLMASPPLTDRPTSADMATILALYHTPATVVP